mmetsp:Transcript_113006/g.292187  ORF Transcript_113006/g.292187 Transcript_113006/m.292187 type:complete len:251 (-) Transcript_113006:47-799(-)
MRLASSTMLLHVLGFSSTVALTAQDWPPVKGVVQFVGFVGDQTNFNESAPHMRWTGHLGLRFRNATESIYGFSPATPLRTDMGALVSALLDGMSFPGRVADDSADFVDAASSPYGFLFVFSDVMAADCAEEDCGFRHALSDAKRWTIAGKDYAFPPNAPRAYRNKDYSACDDTWLSSCFNCGTYPASLGLPLPDTSGMFDTYMPALAARSGAVCRCYKSGQWRPSTYCDNVREKRLFETCRFEEPAEQDL